MSELEKLIDMEAHRKELGDVFAKALAECPCSSAHASLMKAMLRVSGQIDDLPESRRILSP